MGRHKSYDEQTVLQALAALFSEAGYEATSIDQISKATGMKRGSIYQAFGSKANLFRLAFEFALDRQADADQLADLLFVALWERAGIDPEVRSTAEKVISHLELRAGMPMESILRQRLFLRSGVGQKAHATTQE